MAISGSFKIQCPSCEGFMLIKDPKFIGKKVDCPKCKYRFVVENPAVKDKQQVAASDTASSKKKETAVTGKTRPTAVNNGEAEVEFEETNAKTRPGGKAPPGKRRLEEAEEDAEPEGRKSKKKKKKPAAKSNKMLFGIILGGVGLIVVAVAAIFLMGDGDAPKKQAKGGPPAKGDGKAGGDGGGGKKKGGGDDTGPGDGGPNQQVIGDGSGSSENTNLVPPNSEGIYHCKFKDFIETRLGKAAFGSGGLFNDADFKQRLGISIKEVDEVLTAESYSENWIFHVVHTAEVVKDMRPLIQAMGLVKWAENPTKHECYAVQPGSAGWVLTLAKMSLFVPSNMLIAQPPNSKDRPLVLHMRDPQTLIFAHPEPMKQYLEARGGFKPNPDNLAAVKDDPNADPSRVQPYLTLEPGLRQILLRVQGPKDQSKVLLSSAADLRNVETGAKMIFRAAPVWDIANLLGNKAARIQYVGMALANKDDKRYTFANSIKCKNTDASQQVEAEMIDDIGPRVRDFFMSVGKHKVDLVYDDPTPPDPSPTKTGQPPDPNQPPPAPKKKAKDEPQGSFIKLAHDGRFADFTLNLIVPIGKAAGNLEPAIQLMALGIKGEADSATGMDYKFQLANAGKMLGEKGLPKKGSQQSVLVPPGTFPPGAFPRSTTEMWNAREPNQRVSWMAGLLPYLGHDALYNKIQFDKSWRDGPNWLAARATVPQFLDPTFPLYSRFAGYPGMPVGCATTHYVGIAGVGLDAADAQVGDANMAGKLGVFGYNRMTSLDYIKDKGRGASNTVLMIRVPYDGPAGPTPWLAGGGSTVRSVPWEKSIDPFLSPTGSGDAGTYVVMVDGSVRFLKKGMSDAAFKAICTIGAPGPEDEKFGVEYPPLTPPKVEEKPLGKEPVAVGKGTVQPAVPGNQVVPIPKGWQQFKHNDGGFTINMPAGTAPSTDPGPGGSSLEGFKLKDEMTRTLFWVAFGRVPPQELKLGVERIFNDFKKGLQDTSQLPVISDKNIKYGNFPGREIAQAGDTPAGKAAAFVRVYIIDDRFFSLTATSPGLSAGSPEYRAFFESFKVTGTK